MKRIIVLICVTAVFCLGAARVGWAQMINGVPALTQQEADLAQAAWDKADKGNPDPAWKGKNFTIGVYSAGQRGAISGPVYYWRNKFQELTGATYDIVEIPYAELREKIFTDLQTGSGRYDIIINCSTYYGDYIANDWVLPLDKYFDDPRMPKWDRKSISPAVANLYQWGNHWYGSNNDHDAMILYWRKDILSDPKWQAEFKKVKGHAMPVKMDTWDDVLEIAQFFNGKPLGPGGKPIDGMTMHLKVGGQGMFHFMALSAPYVVIPYPGKPATKVDRYHNIYWFDPVTMEPIINSPGHVAALEMLMKLSKAGSPAMWGWSLGEAWADFLSGNAVFCFSWGDVGALCQDPTQSKIQGLEGARGLPGTLHPYDMQQKKFLTLSKPNLVGNQVGCSWNPVLSKYAKDPDLCYYWMALQATPSINHFHVLEGWSGLNPGTTYDWFPPYGTATPDEYEAAGWNKSDATYYVNAYQDDFYSYPIFQNYLRIPGTPEMQEIWDVHLCEAITGQITAKQALDRTAADWKRIVNDIGKDQELKLYRESIGYK